MGEKSEKGNGVTKATAERALGQKSRGGNLVSFALLSSPHRHEQNGSEWLYLVLHGGTTPFA